ncbi:unnamed protein product [Caenorhabditis brenneri]
MEFSEEISKYAKCLETGQNVYQSLRRLLQIKASFESFRNHKVKQLASKYSNNVDYSEIAKNLINRIQRMEDDSKLFRKPYNIRHSNRKRSSTSSSNSKSSLKLPDISKDSSRSSSRNSSVSAVKEPELIEVSKLQNLEESDYDRVRPTLITLSAKQLKSFMDRNPRIETIADGLFRRHCQRDCPEEVPKKLKMETWRTVHDVHVNWKLYEEAKLWEKKLKEGIHNVNSE